MKQEIVTEKVCRRCKLLKPIEKFRPRKNGFILNQCRECESELGAIRRQLKKEISPVIEITTKSGQVIQAYTVPVAGGHMTTSPKTDKVLYFSPDVNRDKARLAFSTYADIERTGISFKSI